MDVVHNLVNVKRFFKYTHEEKLELKNRGRPLPDINIEIAGISRGKSYTRHFNRDIYSRNDWLCGCNKKNALFCFPCVLFEGDKTWSKTGIRDLVHLTEKMKKHENSKSHLYYAMEYALLGTVNIRAQLDTAYWRNIHLHNDNVIKNRYVLSKIINCIKFCSAFELALRGHDETETSTNPGIFHGLINFSAELDSTLREHLEKTSVFKGCSKEIQNDLLDCMLEVSHEDIVKEINDASYLALIADDTTDVSLRSQLVIVLRYTSNGEPIERFWTYLPINKCDAKSISLNILSVLDPLIEKTPSKLIAQSYNGAAVMSGQHAGVQAKIKEQYPFAYFVHYYAHELNLVMSRAASMNSQVRVFFGNLKEIPTFFNNSPQSVDVLNEVVGKKISQEDTPCWNFNIRTINIVYENKDALIQCMEEIQETFTNTTVCCAASNIHRMLEDPDFLFWLTYFHHVMPHVDVLFNQLQERKTGPTEVKTAIDNFEKQINNTRNSINEIVNEASNIFGDNVECKRKRMSNSTFDHRLAALEVCDVILNSAKDRFAFRDHLQAASLLASEYFAKYCTQFPDEQLNATCLAYPAVDKERLKTELSLIYSKEDCRRLNGSLPLLKFLIQNNLQNTLKETKNILEILITTPMSTTEDERCFSTLKRIKTFLQNSMSQDRLTALGMLSIEKEFISKITDFNNRVIDKFASKDHRIDLIFKKSNLTDN